MIMDAGLLTVTSVRENNNQHTGSESAVFAPHWNADTLMLMLDKKNARKRRLSLSLGAELSPAHAFLNIMTRFGLLERRLGEVYLLSWKTHVHFRASNRRTTVAGKK